MLNHEQENQQSCLYTVLHALKLIAALQPLQFLQQVPAPIACVPSVQWLQ